MRKTVPAKVFSLFFLLMFLPAFLFAETPVFEASWWCQGAHLQTITGGLLRKSPKFFYRRERIDLPDGDFLDVDWLDGEPLQPTLLVIPGLASNSESPYVKIFAAAAHAKQWNIAVMNVRGQSGEPNRLMVTSHGGRSQDVKHVVEHILFTRKVKEMYGVGFSLGGNMLLKWLGESPKEVPSEFKKAVAVSTAFDLRQVADLLDKKWFNRNTYTRSLLRSLKRLALAKEKQFPGCVDRKKVQAADTLRIYDREVTAKLNGFPNEEDYWSKSSSIHFLQDIPVPVLLIHAANDPFLPAEYFPFDEVKRNRNLSIEMTSDGGHVGFVSGKRPGRLGNWLESRVLDYFDETTSSFERKVFI